MRPDVPQTPGCAWRQGGGSRQPAGCSTLKGPTEDPGLGPWRQPGTGGTTDPPEGHRGPKEAGADTGQEGVVAKGVEPTTWPASGAPA